MWILQIIICYFYNWERFGIKWTLQITICYSQLRTFRYNVETTNDNLALFLMNIIVYTLELQ